MTQSQNTAAVVADLDQLPLPSIDTPEFHVFMNEYDNEASYGSLNKARADLVTFIGKHARAAVAAFMARSAAPAPAGDAAEMVYRLKEHLKTVHNPAGATGRLLLDAAWMVEHLAKAAAQPPAKLEAAPVLLMNAAAKVIRAWRDSPVNGKDDWLRDQMAELIAAHNGQPEAAPQAEPNAMLASGLREILASAKGNQQWYIADLARECMKQIGAVSLPDVAMPEQIKAEFGEYVQWCAATKQTPIPFSSWVRHAAQPAEGSEIRVSGNTGDGVLIIPTAEGIRPMPRLDQFPSLEEYKKAMDAYDADMRVKAVPAEGSALVARYYMDHGVLHDRVTGQHMWTQDQYDEAIRDHYEYGREDEKNGFPRMLPRPAPASLPDVAMPDCPVTSIITGVREFYLGLLSRHLPPEAFDQARTDDATLVAYQGVADRFLTMVESIKLAAQPAEGSAVEPECARCGSEGMIYVEDATTPCPTCQDLSDYDDTRPAEVSAQVAWTEERVTELSKNIAIAVAKNASTVPQLCFPDIYLGLKDALAAPERSDTPAGLDKLCEAYKAFRKAGSTEQYNALLDAIEFVIAPTAASKALDAAAPAGLDWISVDDWMPDDSQPVLVVYWPYNNHENEQVIGSGYQVDGVFYGNDGDEIHPPSHWMPRPALPSNSSPVGADTSKESK